MSTAENSRIYQRGKFWLAHNIDKSQRHKNSNLYIYWYDTKRGRQCRKTTGTANIRLACDALDVHFLATQTETPSQNEVYQVSHLLVDYFVEHGSTRVSAEAIKARLKPIQTFIDIEVNAGRLSDPVLPNQLNANFIDRFRKWSLTQQIVSNRKDGLPGKMRLRSASTVEESIIQLKAAINHAIAHERILPQAPIKHLTRRQVTPVNHERISIVQIGEMLSYSVSGAGHYSGHPERLIPLRRYLIAAITTLARPDAIFDMSVLPARQQWIKDDNLFALNPRGRLQTKKHRPVIPVCSTLKLWLESTNDWFIHRPLNQSGLIVEVPTRSIKSAWRGMRQELKLPDHWAPKLLRHSMATELRRRGVNGWDLAGLLGHKMLGTSEIYAIYDPNYLSTVRLAIDDVVSDLRKSCGNALDPVIHPLACDD